MSHGSAYGPTAVASIFALLSTLSPPVHAGDPAFRLKDLGTLGGTSSYGYSINASGQVTGTASTVGNTAGHAFLWGGGYMQDLGAFGGTYSSGNAINDEGQVTGHFDSGGEIHHAFLWDGTTMRDLGTLGGARSYGQAINGSGHVTGDSSPGGNVTHAFLWNGSNMRDLGTLGGSSSWGWAINDQGQVTGVAYLPGDTARHAFLWDGALMRDLGSFGGWESWGVAINELGQVTGYAKLPGDVIQHVFLWDGTTMRDLGTLGGTTGAGSSINDSGHVVGASRIAGNVAQHAFVWDGATMRDLGTLGGTNSGASAINAAGLVVGHAQTSANVYHAFLWDGAAMRDLNELVHPDDPLRPYVTLIRAGKISEDGTILAQGIDGRTSEEHAYLVAPVPADESPPSITVSITGTIGQNAWYVSDVQLAWIVSDPDSTISSSTGCGPSNIVADTAGAIFTCSAESEGGASAQTVLIKRDATAPTATVTVQPPANEYGWHNQDMTITVSGSDSMSGAVTCNPPVTVTTEGSGRTVLLGRCNDAAGNHSALVSTGDLNLDKTPPAITIVTPSNGATYKRKDKIFANYSCADGLSGLLACAGTVSNGQQINMPNKVGNATFTVNATDRAGNSFSRTITYNVK